MKPNFPLNYDELVQELMAKGSYSFEIKIGNKEKLRKALNRCRRDRSLLAQADSIFGRIRWLIYAVYATLMNEFAFRNDRSGSSAITYFYVASEYISSVEGTDLNESTTRITYVART